MASPFETEGSFLTQEQADHINERHVFKKEHVRTSKFGLQFDLVDMLKNVSELTWEENMWFYYTRDGKNVTDIFICSCLKSTSKSALIQGFYSQ